MGNRKRNRSIGKIDRLPDYLKDTVEQMLLAGSTYKEIVSYLAESGEEVSQMSVCRYASKYLATVEMLQVAQENFRMMSDEIEKYPNLDTTEVILRIASQQVLSALTDKSWEDLQEEDSISLLKTSNALVRAVAYKRKTDLQNKTDLETALEANKSLLFDVLAKKHPDLFKQVMAAVKEEQELLQEGS